MNITANQLLADADLLERVRDIATVCMHEPEYDRTDYSIFPLLRFLANLAAAGIDVTFAVKEGSDG